MKKIYLVKVLGDGEFIFINQLMMNRFDLFYFIYFFFFSIFDRWILIFLINIWDII